MRRAQHVCGRFALSRCPYRRRRGITSHRIRARHCVQSNGRPERDGRARRDDLRVADWRIRDNCVDDTHGIRPTGGFYQSCRQKLHQRFQGLDRSPDVLVNLLARLEEKRWPRCCGNQRIVPSGGIRRSGSILCRGNRMSGASASTSRLRSSGLACPPVPMGQKGVCVNLSQS